MEPILFETGSISLACISDTCNDECGEHIPQADMFLHAGDMTKTGTYEELVTAYNWIAALPHRIKVIVSGDHDVGLDPTHPSYSEEAYMIFTSPTAQMAGIFYLDREVREVALLRSHDGQIRRICVYCNPCQPGLLESDSSFTYQPHPHPSASKSWATAPVTPEHSDVNIWLTHCSPKDRLDAVPPTGCEVLANCIAKARPLLAVFGHHHDGYGVEKVTWDLMEDRAILAERLSAKSTGHEFDLSAPEMLDKDLNTLFVNAAYMTAETAGTEKRNMPWWIKINFDTDEG